MEDQHSNTRLDTNNPQDYQATSSITAHFETNYAPTDDELAKIRSLLIAPTARLEELKAMMKQKEDEHYALFEQHTQLERDIAKYRALVHPMRRLPVDLLREVFLHCIPTDHNAILSRVEEPMSLTRVCSAWRAVALATPALWASLHITVPLPISSTELAGSDVDPVWSKAAAENAMRMRTRMVQEWLLRSGACRLDISLHDQERLEYQLPNANYEEFLKLIIPHSRRWRSMTFNTIADSLIRVAALDAEDVPALEDIAINVPYFMHTLPGVPDFPLLSWGDKPLLSAPRLRRVTFSNLGENINTLPLHFRHLTHISLKSGPGHNRNGHTSLANISLLLEKCHNLTSARLQIAYQHVPQSATPAGAPPQPICTRPIVLPHLVHLSLLTSEEHISSFFAMLDAPQLRVLEYHNRVPGQGADDFIAFLSRVSETLTSVTTSAGMFSRSDFFAMLKATRRLRSLVHDYRNSMEFYGSRTWGDIGTSAGYFDDIFLDAAPEDGEDQAVERAIEDYSQILLPELENLDCGAASFTDDGLLEFLKLRQNLAGRNADVSSPGTPLRRFYLHLDRKATRETVREDVAPFEDAGLVLRLAYSQAPMRDPFSPADGIQVPSVTSFPFAL
ncbi:hypothetical protein BJ912DRAFT_934401 [Pholiota molesta]|nr:hypothetical protein BJ912DRAFT_934401 [Pholiota molesta]